MWLVTFNLGKAGELHRRDFCLSVWSLQPSLNGCALCCSVVLWLAAVLWDYWEWCVFGDSKGNAGEPATQRKLPKINVIFSLE